MKLQKKATRILVLLSLVLIPSWFIFTGTGEAIGTGPGGAWELTPTAVQRTAAGDCPGVMKCREYCYYGEPQGDFMCFNN